MFKKIGASVCAAFVLALSILPIGVAHAYDYDDYYDVMDRYEDDNYAESAGSSTIYMHDMADLFTDEEEKNLIETASKFVDDIGHNVLFLTYNDAMGRSTMVYSDDYMDVLFPDTDENVAFVIDMDNREVYINTMGTYLDELNYTEIEECLDAGYDYMPDGKYYDAILRISAYTLQYVNGGSIVGTPLFGSKLLEVLPMSTIGSAGLSAIVAVVLLLNHRKANNKEKAQTYLEKGGYYKVVDKKEDFVNSYTRVHKDYYKPKESSSSGGGGSHSSGGGRSHGGGGRSF